MRGLKVRRTRRRSTRVDIRFTYTVPPAMARGVARERRRIIAEMRAR
jgi:hypothetical protein